MNGLLVATLLASFRFSNPEGWTDLSRCADEQTLKALPEEVQDDARRACGTQDGGIAFAVDLRHLDENAVATFSAVIVSGAPVIDDAVATKMAEGFVNVAARKGEKLELVEARAEPLSGQKGARLRFLRTHRGDRMDVYVVPHAQQTALLTFVTPISRYEEYQPVFATVANDVIATPPPDEFTTPLKIIAFLSVVSGAALGFYLLVIRRRRRTARAQRPELL